MEKLLFVSYNHNSGNVADSVQNHRLIPALSNYFDIDILQRKNNRLSEGIWSPNLFIIDRIIYKFFPCLISVFSVDRWLWSLVTFRRIKKALIDYRYVIMVYEPYTTRFLHYRIRRDFRSLKIVSLLYDPYADNIFFSRSKRGIILRERVERKIVNKSDLVILNSHMLLDVFRHRYSNASFFYIPFCGLPTAFCQEKEVKHEGKLSILHTGNLHGARNIDVLNQSISLVKFRYEGNLADVLQVLMFGHCPEIDKNKVRQCENDDVIVFGGYISQDDLKMYQLSCDALLLINPVGVANYSYPSKLCEYFQQNKIILSISSSESAANFDLVKAGHIVCNDNGAEIMANAILDLISDRSYFNLTIDKKYYKKFIPDNVAKEYYKLINQL